ncbi:Glycoprotein 3-alpha-L-fucosyltransferase A [Echinococcus granulosus]|uniref:Fucosyltransferase n=2 Tax=Echinococcus granulosus TaxID=6210 RepID=A0A068X203_ECHGR|nr:Glycoprotein 3-alpha-L-fucosyltransferase A [Echinococcus granulosus]CDS24799.1 glycoprotein 3 alpha L fucosyltransferase [Echinococcus granulosus]
MMHRRKMSAVLLASAAVALTLLILFWNVTLNEKSFKLFKLLPFSASSIPSILIPYHHVIDQLEWITDFATDKTDFPSANPPVIYYDRQIIYHPTTSDGCRYKCIFAATTQDLSQGDVAVFSNHFSVETSISLKKRGVLIAFETGECPFLAPSLRPAHLNQIDLFITYMPKSPVPFVYSVFVRNKNPKYRFTTEEAAFMLSKNYVHLLPPHHRQRRRLIAWAVSDHQPNNNRAEYASAIAKFIPVDIYGSKGRQLPHNAEAFHLLSLDYKFYLAFENANCRNYITEKVYFNAMQCVMFAS